MLCVSVFIKMSLLQGYRHFTDLQWKDSDTKRSSKDMRREKKKSFHRQTLGLERTLKNKYNNTTTFLLLVIIFSSFMIPCVTPCGGPNPHVGNQTYPQFPSDPCLWRYVCVCMCVCSAILLCSPRSTEYPTVSVTAAADTVDHLRFCLFRHTHEHCASTVGE